MCFLFIHEQTKVLQRRAQSFGQFVKYGMPVRVMQTIIDEAKQQTHGGLSLQSREIETAQLMKAEDPETLRAIWIESSGALQYAIHRELRILMGDEGDNLPTHFKGNVSKKGKRSQPRLKIEHFYLDARNLERISIRISVAFSNMLEFRDVPEC